ncbi:unnamed protein product [Cuscuta campestris]|uniref:Retrotransposon gag domain-containing protein n=1 Tax=Cuscuta campestris TaxID=132261 RepID=A0A484KLE7_9ASTE|nr:unnamed protein product [Cuscuta campestris]
MSSSQQINATSAQVQGTTEGVSDPIVVTPPANSASVMSLGLTHVPTPSMATPFTVPIPSVGPRVTFPPSMTQFMNDPANLQAIQGFGQVMAMCQEIGGMPFLPGMFPFALPGAGTMPLQTPMAVSPFQTPVPQQSLFQPQLQMEAKLEKLEKKIGEKNDQDKPLVGSPFTTRVHLMPFPRKVKIDAPSDLASKFKAKFQENCTKRKKFTYLSTVGQRESENLTQFLTRWKEEVDKVEEMDDKTILSLLLNGLRAGELYKELYRKPPATYQEAYHTA